MQYEILLTKNPGNGYTARPMLWPEMAVSGEDEGAVLMCVQEKLTDLVKNSRVVSVDIPTNLESGEPSWMQSVNILADIPEEIWQEHLAEIANNRRILDLQMQDIDQNTAFTPFVEDIPIKLAIESNVVYS